MYIFLKMQSILDNWIQTDNKQKICNIMYLNWSETNPKVLWLLKPPEDVIFKKKINWNKINVEVLICGNIDSNLEQFPEKFKYTSLLKSNLQKCIRQGLVSKSLSTAKLMIKTDFIEFIRRLSIIMLEDTTLNIHFNTLMWMIAAYPQWLPNKKHINWLLGLVKYLAELPVKDNIEKGVFDFKQSMSIINSLSDIDKSIIYCLNLRLSYGGMKGDMSMIQYLINLWINRFKNRDNLEYVYNDVISYSTKIKNIKVNEIEESAVDFHCYPKILNLIRIKFLKYSLEEIKLSIWHNRSSKNIRRNINNLKLDDSIEQKYIDIWIEITQEVSKISKNYIKNLLL